MGFWLEAATTSQSCFMADGIFSGEKLLCFAVLKERFDIQGSITSVFSWPRCGWLGVLNIMIGK